MTTRATISLILAGVMVLLGGCTNPTMPASQSQAAPPVAQKRSVCVGGDAIDYDVLDKMSPHLGTITEMQEHKIKITPVLIAHEQQEIDCIRDWEKATQMDECIKQTYEKYLRSYQSGLDDLKEGKLTESVMSIDDLVTEQESNNPIPAPPRVCPRIKP